MNGREGARRGYIARKGERKKKGKKKKEKLSKQKAERRRKKKKKTTSMGERGNSGRAERNSH